MTEMHFTHLSAHCLSKEEKGNKNTTVPCSVSIAVEALPVIPPAHPFLQDRKCVLTRHNIVSKIIKQLKHNARIYAQSVLTKTLFLMYHIRYIRCIYWRWLASAYWLNEWVNEWKICEIHLFETWFIQREVDCKWVERECPILRYCCCSLRLFTIIPSRLAQ